MKILKHPIFAPCTCDKCMTVFQADANDELETVCYEGVIQAWKIECPVCRHWCNLEWAGIINQSDVTDTNVGRKSEWISVEERLPEEHKNVLCFERGKTMIAFMEKTEDCGTFVPVFWDYVAYDRDDTWDEVCATHWMPLPEPPKGV